MMSQKLPQNCDRCTALERDLESGFMPGAYARLKYLQDAERERDAYREALKGIHEKCEWYANIHRGPDNEVHHALKVEINHDAYVALSKYPAPDKNGPHCYSVHASENDPSQTLLEKDKNG